MKYYIISGLAESHLPQLPHLPAAMQHFTIPFAKTAGCIYLNYFSLLGIIAS